jgi:hypothetical protein
MAYTDGVTEAMSPVDEEFGSDGLQHVLLTPQQQVEIRKMVSKGDKTAPDAAWLFKIHPATVSRLLARTLPSARKAKRAK